VASVNPSKLVRDFTSRSGNPRETWLNWTLPVELEDNEEVVVVRRKDAFPVELKNPNYEDRYTDLAQVEVFRGRPIYVSHLAPASADSLTLVSGASFSPSSFTGFERDNKYKGRLLRDSLGQVFKITSNTEDTLFYENIATNEDKQIVPREGAFVILADFPTQARSQETFELLPDSYTLRVENNSFSAGDKVTIRNDVELEFGTEWTAGVDEIETARNIRTAINDSGVQYLVTQFDNVLLIEKSVEDTLNVEVNTVSLGVLNYAASGDKFFVADGTFSKNELRDLVIQNGGNTYFVRRNEGKEVELYEDLSLNEIQNSTSAVLNSFNNSFVAPFRDTFLNYLQAYERTGTGLEDEKYYYYSAFSTPFRSSSVFLNEETAGGENPLPYSIDRVGSVVTRIFYESIIYANSDLLSFSYDSGTGEVTFSGSPDLSQEDIQVGDLFGDAQGRRFSITDISQLASGIIGIATGISGFGTNVETAIHGAITRANTPVNFNNTQVGDTFTDLAGNSFEIVGTAADPASGVTTPPANSFDVTQGQVAEVIFKNDFLIPFTYDPETSSIQYGEEQVAINELLASFTYTSGTGVVQYSGASIDLTSVQIGDTFVDGARNEFDIEGVNHNDQTLTLDTGLTVDNTVDDNRDGSVKRIVGFTDAEGNLLIELEDVQVGDFLRTNSRPNIEITAVDAASGQVTIVSGLEDISTIVENPFDGSINRKGKPVEWIGFDGELSETLTNVNQGAVRRYASVYDSQLGLFSTPVRTQDFAISTQDRGFGTYIYNLFPRFFRQLDQTGDLEDFSQIMGKEFNESFSIINTYELQNADLVYPAALQRAAVSKGLELTSENLGIDTRRRVVRDLTNAFKKKGTREGIFEFIKILTTWDITAGTANVREAIVDDSPEVVGLRFFSPSLGDDNTRFVNTLDLQSPPAGRFFKGTPGINLPEFFQFTEITINLPNVALEIGTSSALAYSGTTTILSDGAADFGATNSLRGAFVIPNEGNPSDFYEIIANTQTTITLQGRAPRDVLGTEYVILSPLNLNRFVALSDNISEILPHDVVAVFNFTLLNL